jgi:hypothetical protein
VQPACVNFGNLLKIAVSSPKIYILNHDACIIGLVNMFLYFDGAEQPDL